jgi:hypothetical protein
MGSLKGGPIGVKPEFKQKKTPVTKIAVEPKTREMMPCKLLRDGIFCTLLRKIEEMVNF